jgi:hypothetical protein
MSVTLREPGPVIVHTFSATTFAVEIGNRGDETWCSNGGPFPIHLSYHWMSEDGEPLVWEGVRTPLPSDVASGDSLIVRIFVHSPEVPGNYYWNPAAVQEGVRWIPDASHSPTQLVVRVED